MLPLIENLVTIGALAGAFYLGHRWAFRRARKMGYMERVPRQIHAAMVTIVYGHDQVAQSVFLYARPEEAKARIQAVGRVVKASEARGFSGSAFLTAATVPYPSSQVTDEEEANAILEMGRRPDDPGDGL